MSGWRLGPYRAVGHTFQVHGNAADVVRARLSHSLAPLSDPTADPATDYRVEDAGHAASTRYTVSAGGRVLVETSSTATAAGFVVWHVNQMLIRIDRGRHLVLHAAGVRRGGVTVALPAPMESGKTTTCAGLLRAGFEYLTDEALVIDRVDGSITPFPKALSLDRGSREAIGSLPAPPYRNADTDVQWQVPWWELGSPGVAQSTGVDVVVLPAFRQGADTALEPVPPGEAVMALAESTFEFGKRPRQNLELLARMAESRPVYRLRVGDLAAAVDLVCSLVGEPALAHGRSA